MLKLLQQHSKPCVALSTGARSASSPRLVTRVAVILTVLFMFLFTPNSVGAQDIIELRTETSRTYANEDGTYTTEIGGGVLHWKYDYTDLAEPWRDIDLTPDKDGSITQAPYICTIKDGTYRFENRQTGAVATLRPHEGEFELVPFNRGIHVSRVVYDKSEPLTSRFDLAIVGDGIKVTSQARDATGANVTVKATYEDGVLTETIEWDSVKEWPVTIDPVLEVQPSDKDTFIMKDASSANFGDATEFVIRNPSANVRRSLIGFDISGLAASANITDAFMELYYQNSYSVDPVGEHVWAYNLTRPDWVEMEATWDIYKTGSSWSTAGGDYETSEATWTAMPASYGWVSWDVSNITRYAFNSTITVDILLRFDNEASGDDQIPAFFSNDYEGDTSRCPKLTINYFLPPTDYPLGPVTNFVVNQTGVSSCNLTWTAGGNATRTVVVGSIEDTPTSVTDGYLIYNGTANVTSIEGLALLGTTYYWSAWSQNVTHTSLEYANTSLGGEAMTNVLALALLAVLAMGFTGMFFWKRMAVLAFGAAGSWALLGFLSLTTSTAASPTEITDVWMGMFWLCMMFTVACALLPAIMREKPEPEDIYVDNVDCAGDDVSSIMPDRTPEDEEHRPERRKRVVAGSRPGIVKFRR